MNKPILTWDTLEIAENEAEYRSTEGYIDGEKPDYETALDDAFQDSFLYEIEWECMTEALTEAMKNTTEWKAKGKNMGWRNLEGEKTFTANNGADFLHEILPDTDCTFYIYPYYRGFKIVNYHHDSPTGETYYILPA